MRSIIIASLICVAVMISGSLSAVIQVHSKSSKENSIVVKRTELVQVIHKLQTATTSEIWSIVLLFIQNEDIQGLIEYLEKLPETKLVLKWLQEYHPDLFLGVCWLFDACDIQDVVIDPAIIQKILRFISENDWDGLVTYLKTLDAFAALADWIKSNFPEAWENICDSVELPC